MFTLAVLLATLASAYALSAFTHSFSIPKIIGKNEWNPSFSFTHGDLHAESDSAGRNSLPPIYAQCTTPDTVALAFGGGPYDFMYNISDTLTANGAKGTFHPLDFLGSRRGHNYQFIYSDENIKRLRYVVAQGHQIASHTWSHPHLEDASPYWTLFTTSLKDDQVREELSKIHEAILRITGLKSSFLRPLFGSSPQSVRSIAASRGQALVIWSYDSGDSQLNARSSSSVREQRSGYDSSWHFFLNHDAYDTMAHELVPYAVTKLKAAGYKMVTLVECLGLDAYQAVPIPVPPSKKDPYKFRNERDLQ
ncbi:carbohydrate esterase family 4 protein [Hydnum rufescens UP504]|uniref:Carbohydrate esterase family 4 protein n=1 Tax=Hydnum rufescens UP504 TaxID=1448309 RepID=A0A9P6AUK0_9AGAM|nr:carbohydrate esterase family 4 protein [Hydnum rufescens UP504]